MGLLALAGLHCPGYEGENLGNLKRLEDIVKGPKLHGFNSRIRRSIGGHDQHGRTGGTAAHGLKRGEAVHAWQAHIHDDALGVQAWQPVQGLGAGSRCDHFITFILKKLLKPLKQQRIIID